MLVFRVCISLILFHRLSHGKVVRLCALYPHSMLIERYARLLFYTPSATLVRLCTTNALIALATSWDLYLSGASEDPRMLLPAWISITTVGRKK